jgi:hypothetical protein
MTRRSAGGALATRVALGLVGFVVVLALVWMLLLYLFGS